MIISARYSRYFSFIFSKCIEHQIDTNNTKEAKSTRRKHNVTFFLFILSFVLRCVCVLFLSDDFFFSCCFTNIHEKKSIVGYSVIVLFLFGLLVSFTAIFSNFFFLSFLFFSLFKSMQLAQCEQRYNYHCRLLCGRGGDARTIRNNCHNYLLIYCQRLL